MVKEEVAPGVRALAELAPPGWEWAFEWPVGVAVGVRDVRVPPEGVGGI